jgi:hypothetical protein
MLGSGWIIARTHPAHYGAMVLLFVAVEVIGIPLKAFASSVSGFYYWILPMTKITNAVFYHFGVVTPVAMWVSAGITVMSILIGAGFFRSVRGTGSQALQSATT